MGGIIAQNVELTGIINKPLLFHLVGVYIIYIKQISRGVFSCAFTCAKSGLYKVNLQTFRQLAVSADINGWCKHRGGHKNMPT